VTRSYGSGEATKVVRVLTKRGGVGGPQSTPKTPRTAWVWAAANHNMACLGNGAPEQRQTASVGARHASAARSRRCPSPFHLRCEFAPSGIPDSSPGKRQQRQPTTPWTNFRGNIALDTRAVMGVPGTPRNPWNPSANSTPSSTTTLQGRPCVPAAAAQRAARRQPRATPWVEGTPRFTPKPCRGETKHRLCFIAPLQGLNQRTRPEYPGRCPGLWDFSPSG